MTDHTIFLALGSNVGEQEAQMDAATQLLSPKVVDIQRASFYRSKPMGVIDQPDFVNTALKGRTSLSPTELLEFVKGIEQQIGRVYRYRWGPREIDIDIIFYDDLVIKSANLEIPHARAHERDFVLRPIADLDPTFIHPVFDKKVGELLSSLLSENKAILE